jgi:glycine/D-amino acid oxidase-like deaminating enzyme
VGFTGHGFGFAWMAGEALAAMVSQGEHPFATEFSPQRMR